MKTENNKKKEKHTKGTCKMAVQSLISSIFCTSKIASLNCSVKEKVSNTQCYATWALKEEVKSPMSVKKRKAS